MMENVLNHIGGIGVFGVISISLFFSFFAGMLLWAGRLKRNYLQTMEALPLDESERGCVAKTSRSAHPSKTATEHASAGPVDTAALQSTT